MIRRLKLTNWRNYTDVDQAFEAGTTFVVAANGVGKTSIVEAARWAVFGDIADENSAIQAGATTATATVELELPNLQILTISRDLIFRKNSRTSGPAPTVTLDGAPVAPDTLERLLAEHYKTEPAFLASVTMPPASASQGHPEKLGLEEHLGRFYGVHGLRQAADTLIARRKQIDKKITSVKNANSASAKLFQELQTQTEDAATELAAAETTHAKSRTDLDNARRTQAAEAQVAAWQRQRRSRDNALTALRRDLVQLLASRPYPTYADRRPGRDTDDSTLSTSDRDQGGVQSAIDDAVAAERDVVTQIDIRLGVIAGTIATLTVNQEKLDSAHDDCPVCRRPLDEATTSAATATTAHDIATLNAEQDDLAARRDQHTTQLAALSALQTRARTIPPLPPQPTVPEPNESGSDLDSLLEAEQDLLEVLIQARTRLATTQQRLDDATAADQAMRELVALFDQQARLTIAIETTQRTLRDLLQEAVAPMASAVNSQWTSLFPDRGPLDTTSNGNVTRKVYGHDLPFDSFSTGEGAGLTLLIRLVVTTMATNADFCWFDEPLEHLDPDTRRHLASMLTRAGSGEGPLRQIVLTTYEEPLARQLKLRDPDRVHLIDVRQAAPTV
jgi:DNA repair exonuclease SbcCD ATPase subunit